MIESLSWFFFAILATLLLGTAMVFYKFPSAKKMSRYNVSFWSLTTSAVLAIVFFFSYLYLTTNTMLLLAVLWGASFLALSLSQMYALGHIETNTLFPVTSIVSLVVTVFAGLAFFKEQITLIQTLGVIIVITTVYSSIFNGVKLKYSSSLIGIGIIIVFFSAFNKILQKLAADKVDIHAFQIYQYLFAVLFSLVAYSFVHRKTWRKEIFSGFKIGSAIGIFSFLGGYSLIIALTKGPLTLVFTIFSLFTLVTAVLGYFLFGELLTKRKLILLFMAIIATLVIRFG